MSDQSTEDDGFNLVMPFITVTSVGGPFDDDAYVAGYEMGKLDAILEMGLAQHSVAIQTANVAQADLLAMRHGYRCVTEPTAGAPDWAFATFNLIREAS